jgi:glycosyltransferase involved in cell wall biosynthesis
MSDNVLVSVVIPTYNRYKYLKGAISTFANVESDEIEFVIQDNTEDNSEILGFLKDYDDKRIKYFHKSEHISVVENSNMAIENSKGEYVIFIGDDDTVCSSLVQAAKFCRKHEIDTCISELPGFNWPDMQFKGREAQANLFLTKKISGKVRRINTEKQVRFALKYADGIPEDMPRVYHGLTSRKCLDQIKEKTGSYFPGPSPDMASSLAISLFARKAVYISDYLMVSGYGFKSARGEGNRQAHYGKISEKPWLPKDTEEKWDKEIPGIFSGETIIAESLSRCLRALGREDLLKRYSYGILYAVFFVRHAEARRYMLYFLIKKPVRVLKFFAGIIKRKQYIRYYQKTHTGKNYKEFNGVSTLADAQRIVYDERKKIVEYSFK